MKARKRDGRYARAALRQQFLITAIHLVPVIEQMYRKAQAGEMSPDEWSREWQERYGIDWNVLPMDLPKEQEDYSFYFTYKVQPSGDKEEFEEIAGSLIRAANRYIGYYRDKILPQIPRLRQPDDIEMECCVLHILQEMGPTGIRNWLRTNGKGIHDVAQVRRWLRETPPLLGFPRKTLPAGRPRNSSAIARKRA